MDNTKQHFFLGESWLYFKVYIGFKTADLLLKEIIFPLTQQLKQEKIISHWFFIRYNDPDFHIRIRLFLPNVDKLGSIIQKIHKSLQSFFDDGLIWKIQYDTYNREMERYGEQTIELSEHLFCADSEMVASLLKSLYGDDCEKKRWLLSLRAIDELLSSFGYSIHRKLALLNLLQESFKKEFNINGNLKKQFSLNFRQNRTDVEKIIKVSKEEYPLLCPIFEKSEKTKMLVGQILESENNNILQVPLDSLLNSYIHMMVNRFFRTKPREHELILYDFLYRYYDSEINKIKYQNKNIK